MTNPYEPSQCPLANPQEPEDKPDFPLDWTETVLSVLMILVIVGSIKVLDYYGIIPTNDELTRRLRDYLWSR